MVHAKEINSVLGGQRVIGKRPSTDFDYVELIRQGLPYASLSAAAKALELTEEQVLASLQIPKRTAARRKSSDERLKPTESERLVRLARAVAAAVDVLGNREKTISWLQRPNRALGGVTPLSMLDTDIGLQEVLNVLGRISHGVFS